MATERVQQGAAREEGDNSATAVTEPALASSASTDRLGEAGMADAGSRQSGDYVVAVNASASVATEADPGAGPTASPEGAEAYETAHVHEVYEAIAPHFSATRYKPWPVVASFLLSQDPGSLGLDVGCGNGKYLMVNPHVHILASDRSPSLVKLASELVSNAREAAASASAAATATAGMAAEVGHDRADGSSMVKPSSSDLLVADGLALPFRSGSVDFAISIAVIHHLSTQERRRTAIVDILQCVRPGGRVLLYVWALEQASSRRGWDEGSSQDTLVPWVFRTPRKKTPKQQQQHQKQLREQQQTPTHDRTTTGPKTGPTTFQRYYHLFREGELEEDVRAVGGSVLDAGYDKDNWWVVCTRSA